MNKNLNVLEISPDSYNFHINCKIYDKLNDSKVQEFETILKLFLKINNYEKTNKKGGNKKEGNLPKPLPSFSFFRFLLSLSSTTMNIKKLLADVSLLFQHPVHG